MQERLGGIWSILKEAVENSCYEIPKSSFPSHLKPLVFPISNSSETTKHPEPLTTK